MNIKKFLKIKTPKPLKIAIVTLTSLAYRVCGEL